MAQWPGIATARFAPITSLASLPEPAMSPIQESLARDLPDVASEARPAVAGQLDWVGMDNIELPVLLADGRSSGARVSAKVNLARPDARGIHMPVERLNVALADDNAIASFSVSVREPGQRNWNYQGQLDAFRLRAAGVQLDNEPMDIAPTRELEWRIESTADLARAPVLELYFRPERWLLLTHGNAPFMVAAGSNTQRGGEFPLEALLGQVRAKFGRDWQPPAAPLGAMVPRRFGGGRVE